MYALLINGLIVKPPTPIDTFEDIQAWESIVRADNPGDRIDACQVDQDWITQNLPQTEGPRTERPGAEYGAEV